MNIFRSKINYKDFKDKFEDMDQLDRIEFRQKLLLLHNQFGDPSPIDGFASIIWTTFQLIGYLFLLGVLIFHVFGAKLAAPIMNAIPLVARVMVIALFIMFILNIVAVYFRGKALRKIYSEHFNYTENLEVKNGKRRKG